MGAAPAVRASPHFKTLSGRSPGYSPPFHGSPPAHRGGGMWQHFGNTVFMILQFCVAQRLLGYGRPRADLDLGTVRHAVRAAGKEGGALPLNQTQEGKARENVFNQESETGHLADGTGICALVSNHTLQALDLQTGDLATMHFKELSVVLQTVV